MNSFYDGKNPSDLGLEEELSQVNCQDELEFDYLFEYEPPCDNFPGEDQGLSNGLSSLPRAFQLLYAL